MKKYLNYLKKLHLNFELMYTIEKIIKNLLKYKE